MATYLNDHLAGSITALELLEYLESTQSGTPLEPVFAELRQNITEDRKELKMLMNRLEISESVSRKAAAWLSEKASEFKLRLDDPAGGALRLLEALEVLALGIEGKRSLWLSLATVAERMSALQSVDYKRLIERAEEQRQRVEEIRLEAAKVALRAT